MITAADFTEKFTNKRNYRKEASAIIDKALSLLLEHPITSYQLFFSFDKKLSSEPLKEAIKEELEERGFSLVQIYDSIVNSSVGVSFEFPTKCPIEQ